MTSIFGFGDVAISDRSLELGIGIWYGDRL
jgi:hypothetical protein